MSDLASLTADQFEDWLNDDFRLAGLAPDGAEIPLRLAEVRRHGQNGRAGGAFSLTFVAPKGPVLPQAIYPIEHPGLGHLEIFLVPVGPEQNGNAYEAVFG